MFRQIVRGPQQDMPTMLMIHYLENLVNMYVLSISVILFAMHVYACEIMVKSSLLGPWSGENNGTGNHVFLQQKART